MLFDDSPAGLAGRDVTVREAYDRPRRRADGRPWVDVCMVATVDGSTVLDATSGALSNPVDQEVLLTLRSLADVIIVGSGTVRAEGYGPPRTAGQRIGVVSRRGRVDLHSALFTSGRGFVIMPEDGPSLDVDTVRAGRGDVDLATALQMLDASVVQAEGGPTLNAALAAADLIDELDLTISPRLVGGRGPRLLDGDQLVDRRLRLAHVATDADFLFTRWLRHTS